MEIIVDIIVSITQRYNDIFCEWLTEGLPKTVLNRNLFVYLGSG